MKQILRFNQYPKLIHNKQELQAKFQLVRIKKKNRN